MIIANTIVETYIAEQVDRKIAESRRAADWLRNRVSELQAELLEVQTRVDDFSLWSQRGDHGTPSSAASDW